uniref:Aminotransferase-like plant mobile domain-containing protein n=1 Tax=Fagus sylvatica TaxID=28930 RepID=A0A2N9IFN7_FAGSY
MASSSSHPPPDTAKASGDDSEVPTADAGTMDTGSVGDESVDGSRFSPVPEDDRDDFAFPLLDPWGQEATADRVWAPPLSSISDLRIQRGDMQPVPIDFEFPCSAAADWFHWVADEFMDVEFCALLERAGVAEAILLSRSCNMYRDTEALRQILRRWCTFYTHVLLLMGRTHYHFGRRGEPLAAPLLESMLGLSTFAKATEPTIRRAAFVAYWLYSVCLDEIRGGSCHFITTCFNTSALQTFLWERSLNYQEVGNDNSQIREKFKNMSRHILRRYPDLRTNLPLVYRWTFSCHSVMYWFSDIASQSFELSPDDTRSLTYLSAVNPGWLPVWSDEGCGRICIAHGYSLWGKAWHMHCGDAGVLAQGRLLLWQTMSNKAEGPGFLCPITMHILWRPRLYLPLPKPQFLMPRGRAWASQNGMVHEMGGSCIALRSLRVGKESVKVVEERLRLDSKRGKGSKKTDSGKGASSPAASKQKPKSAAKASSKRPKVAMDMSMIPPSELGDRALMAPGTSKKKQSAAGASKSQKKSAVDPPVDPSEDTSLPSKETESSAIQEESAPPSTKAKSQPRSKSVAVKKAKSKPTRKSAVAPPSSSEEPAAESATPVEKESAVPTPPSTIYDRTRSKRKAVEEQVRSQAKRKVGDEGEGSDQAPIVIEEVSGGDDVVDAGVGATEVNESIVERQEVALKPTDDVAAKDSPIDWTDSDDAMADEALGAYYVVPEAHEITRVMADETLVDVTHETAPVTAGETLAGSAAEEDYDQGTDSVDSEETIADEPQPLQIIPFADQPEEPRAIDPIEFHLNPPFARMTSVVEGVSLFGVAPHFGRILREEGSPMVVIDHPLSGTFTGGQVPALEGIPIQDADDRGMADTEVRGVDVVPEDVETPVLMEKESIAHVVSAAPSSSQTQSAVEVIIPGRVAVFFASFEERAPNPYPDWHFWKFEGPLVAYGNFWVYQDAVPLLQGLSAKFGDFTTHFKFGAGFGGPMLSLLGSVLADMRRTSFKTLSESKILSWRSVVQDLIAVGFDLDFLLEHLRKVARKFFGEAIASEMKVVQEQISSLQSTLAVLVSYQGELMSAAAASPKTVEVASPIDGLFD